MAETVAPGSAENTPAAAQEKSKAAMADSTGNGDAGGASPSSNPPVSNEAGAVPSASPAVSNEEKKAATAPPSAEAPAAALGFMDLYRFVTGWEKAGLYLSFVFSVLLGGLVPVQTLILGELLNSASNPATFEDTLIKMAWYGAILAAGIFLLTFTSNVIAIWVSEMNCYRLRLRYFDALVHQDAAFYDQTKPGEAASRLAEDTQNVQAGTGEKVPLAVTGLCTLLASLILGFSVSSDSWKLALVLLAFVPAVGGVFALLFGITGNADGNSDDAYAKAGAVAAETLELIKTVQAYGGERAELARYDRYLAVAEKSGKKKAVLNGGSQGVFWVTLMVFYSVGLYAGARFILLNREDHPQCLSSPFGEECFSAGEVVQTLFAIINGAAAAGFAAPSFKALASAKVAAAKLFAVIDRKPLINSRVDAGGVKSGKLQGRIEFRDVTFTYQGRVEPVLRNFSLTIEPGERLGIAGSSGSGKSTLISLLLRQYDVQNGCILVDGRDIKEYNASWLRSRLGLVSQEPQLIGRATVAENVAVGLQAAMSLEEMQAAAAAGGALAGKSVQMTEQVMAVVVEACKAANCHDFILQLPQGYDTPISNGSISGGQKQRVAIARALARGALVAGSSSSSDSTAGSPDILLFDECTSALSSDVEREVIRDIEALLDRRAAQAAAAYSSTHAGSAAAPSSAGITSLTIAHRLTTIKNCSKIIVLEKGALLEQGTHAELLALNGGQGGRYAELWRAEDIGATGEATAAGAAAGAGDSAGAAGATAPAAASAAAGAGLTVSVVEAAAKASASSSAAVVPMGIASPSPTSPSTSPAKDAQSKGAAGKAAGSKESAKDRDQPEEDRKVSFTEAKEAFKTIPWGKLWVFLRPEACWFIPGAFLIMSTGVLLPGFSLVLSNFLNILFLPDGNEMERRAREYVGFFMGIACYAMFVGLVGGYALGKASEAFARRLRLNAFTSLVRQSSAFYDLPENTVGRLTSKLGSDAAQLRLILGTRMPERLSSIGTLIAGVVIAFSASWQLALLIMAVGPFYVWAFAVESSVTFTFAEESKKNFTVAGGIASEAMSGIKVVSSFGLQQSMMGRFTKALESTVALTKKRALGASTGVSLSQALQPALPSLLFWVGGILIKQGSIAFGDLFTVFFAFGFTTIGITNATGLAGDLAQLKSALQGLLAVIELQSDIDPLENVSAKAGLQHLPAAAPLGSNSSSSTGDHTALQMSGQLPAPGTPLLTFSDVRFSYPTRPDIPVLKGVNLSIQPGEVVALVGASGQGKSSIISLLLRFYNPSSGSILLQGVDTSKLPVQELRDHISWVQQEAPLFADSIAYNIAYGASSGQGKPAPDQGIPVDAKAEKPEEQQKLLQQAKAFNESESKVNDKIRQAAAEASASSFIAALPYQYATHVGSRGSQMSGGMKQRLALAACRHPDRHPLLYLYDEFVSALQSTLAEEIMQQAVYSQIEKLKAMKERQAEGSLQLPAVIIVAHRLSTVKKADKIMVLHGGLIVEAGTHEQLMALPEGRYRAMALAQEAGAPAAGSSSSSSSSSSSHSGGAAAAGAAAITDTADSAHVAAVVQN